MAAPNAVGPPLLELQTSQILIPLLPLDHVLCRFLLYGACSPSSDPRRSRRRISLSEAATAPRLSVPCLFVPRLSVGHAVKVPSSKSFFRSFGFRFGDSASHIFFLRRPPLAWFGSSFLSAKNQKLSAGLFLISTMDTPESPLLVLQTYQTLIFSSLLCHELCRLVSLIPVIWMFMLFVDKPFALLRHLTVVYSLLPDLIQGIVILVDFSLMEHVFISYFVLELSGCAAGCIVSKYTDTSVHGFRKSLANWCMVAYAFVADFLIGYSALVAVSISSFRSLNVLSNFHCIISRLSIISVEVRDLFHDFICLNVMMPSILLMYVLRFVIAVFFSRLGVVVFYSEQVFHGWSVMLYKILCLPQKKI